MEWTSFLLTTKRVTSALRCAAFEGVARVRRELTTSKYASGRILVSFRGRGLFPFRGKSDRDLVRATTVPRGACSINRLTPAKGYGYICRCTPSPSSSPSLYQATRVSLFRYPILWPNGNISKTLRLRFAANRNSIRAGSRMETSVADTKLHSRRNLRNRSSWIPIRIRYTVARNRICIFYAPVPSRGFMVFLKWYLKL